MTLEIITKELANKIGQIGVELRQKFLKNIPPSTWIWESQMKQVFGITIGDQRIYINPNDDFVAVGYIQGDKNVSGVWEVRNFVRLTKQEKKNLALNDHPF